MEVTALPNLPVFNGPNFKGRKGERRESGREKKVEGKGKGG